MLNAHVAGMLSAHPKTDICRDTTIVIASAFFTLKSWCNEGSENFNSKFQIEAWNLWLELYDVPKSNAPSIV